MDGVKPYVWMRMQNPGARNPALDQPPKPIPRHLAPLAPSPERAVPPPDHLGPKAIQTSHVAGNRVVIEVALHDRPQPRPDLGHRHMPAPPKLLSHRLEFGREA